MRKRQFIPVQHARKKMNKLKGIVFDLDNTLHDFMRAKRIAIEGAAEAMIDAGVKMDPDTIVEKVYALYWRYGMEDQTVFERFLKNEYGKIDYEILGCAIAGYKRNKATVMITYPMVRKTLIVLVKMGLMLGVLSDAPRRPLYTRVAELKLNKYFDNIITADDVGGKKKPDPAPFLRICEVMNLKPEECMMVGDWEERDMVGAKNVGMVTVFASYGDEWDIKDPSADYVLKDSVYELVEIVRQINANPEEPKENGNESAST